MTTLANVRPPHAATDAAKVAALAELYEAQADVTPVVVLTREDGPAMALSGSHRLAAMRTVLDDDTDIDDVSAWIVQLDADELLEALQASDSDRAPEAIRAIESLMDGRGAGDFDRLADHLCALGVIDSEAAAALEDQRR